MATGYMDASEAAYETLDFLVDVYDAKYVLNKLFEYMDVYIQVEFVHYFIKYYEVDTSELNDETLRTINEYYEKNC